MECAVTPSGEPLLAILFANGQITLYRYDFQKTSIPSGVAIYVGRSPDGNGTEKWKHGSLAVHKNGRRIASTVGGVIHIFDIMSKG